jgi:hypothetical protein
VTIASSSICKGLFAQYCCISKNIVIMMKVDTMIKEIVIVGDINSIAIRLILSILMLLVYTSLLYLIL